MPSWVQAKKLRKRCRDPENRELREDKRRGAVKGKGNDR